VKHRPLAFIDIETTGGRSETSRIIDIGVIRVENGEIIDTINQLVRPDMPVPYFITTLTGITNDMLWDQPNFESIAPELELILKDAVFVAHNVDFDYVFIKKEFKRLGISYNSDRACTVKLSRILHPEQRRHGLDKIIERMQLKVMHRHRGFDDAEVLWKYFADEYTANPLKTITSLDTVTTRARKAHSIDSNQLTLI